MRTLLTAALVATSLSGCAALGADDGELHVAAAFYPLAWVAEQVSGGPVDLLTTPGAEPHDFELTIKETALVARADLVVYEHGFQPAVDSAVDENAEGRQVDAAESVDLMTVDGEVDPHFWLDPLLMADLGDAVAGELGVIEPDRREEFRANASELRSRMEGLDAAFTDGLSGCDRDTVVVSHEAFGYLGRYGLQLQSIAGLSPGAEPTPAHLAELQELATTEGVTTVFAEALGTTKLAETLARDLGLSTSTLDPVEGIAADSDDDYVTLMRRNLANLQKANGC